MNPDTRMLEKLSEGLRGLLLRPNGEPVPAHWTIFQLGELVELKGHTFRVAYFNENTVLLEPAPIPVLPAAGDAP